MLQKNEKAFFMSTAIGASRISDCDIKEGAVIVQGRKILSYGLNHRIIDGKEWIMSAVMDALFGCKDNDLRGCVLFCTKFPSLSEMMLIVSAGIKHLYVMENSTDIDTVRFIKDLSGSSMSLEIVKLE